MNVVAIDGPVGSGKSSVARALAERLGWSFLDTGAMYRAVTFEALRRGLDHHDDDAMATLASSVTITTLPRVTIDGRDVTEHLRTPEVNEAVSVVAAQPRVRESMVHLQREFAAAQTVGTVVEGRDIATVVFPDARVKIFLTASLEERSRRRADEDHASIQRRDEIDSQRDASPLRVAPDAKMVDTTGRSIDEIVQEIVTCLTP